MKKFFALLTICALLAFTGSAFAASPEITADPSSVTITAGASATVSLTATPGNEGGTLSAITITDGTAADWATIDGSTLTVTAPATATPGPYTITVSVTETYGDISGHGGPSTATGTRTIDVTVDYPTPTPTVPADILSVTLAPGVSATRTITATASQGGTLTYEKVSGPDWATLSGNTITFEPPEGVTGEFQLVIRVTETAHDKVGTYLATFNIGVGYIGTLEPDISASPASITVVAGQEVASIVTLIGTKTAAAESTSTLAYSKVDGPSWALVLPNGTVAIQPVLETEATEAGTVYTLKARVTERAPGWTTGMKDIDIPITVTAPPFTTPSIRMSGGLQALTLTRGIDTRVVSFTAAPGPDNGTLEFSVSKPSWVTFNEANRNLTLNPGNDVDTTKTYSATVTVTETATGRRSGTAKAALTISVVKNIPPTPKPSIEASSYSVEITAGDAPQTVTFTGTAGSGGTLTYEKVSGPEWATLSGTTLTINPDADVAPTDDGYDVVVRVTETIEADDEDEVVSGSTKCDAIKINVTAAPGREPEEETQEEKDQKNNIAGNEPIEDETQTGEAVEENVEYQTVTEEPTYNLPNDLTPDPDKLGENSKRSTDDALQTMGFTVDQAKAAGENVNITLNDLDRQREMVNRIGFGGASGGNFQRADKDKIQIYNVNKDAQNQKANAFLAGQLTGKKLTSGGSFPGILLDGGFHDTTHKTDKIFYGQQPIFFKNPRYKADEFGRDESSNNNGRNVRSSASRVIAAAEDNGNEAVFLNSNGDFVDVIPDEDDPSGALPGVIVIVTYLEPGVVYEPILAFDVDKLPEEVQVTEDTVEVTVTTTATSTFTPQYNTSFSTMVSWDLISSTVYTNGREYYRISDDTGGRINHVVVSNDWTRTDAELNAMLSNDDYDLCRVVRLPELDGTAEAEDHVYIVSVNLDITTANRDKILLSKDNGAFVFYPNGPLGEPAVSRVMKVVAADGDIPRHLETLTVDEFKNDSNIKTGYLAFRIPKGTELTRPVLTVKLEKTEVTPGGDEPVEDEFSISASARTVTLALNETRTVTYTANNAIGTVEFEISPERSWAMLTPANDGKSASVTLKPTDITLVEDSPIGFVITGTDSEGNTDSETLSVTVTRRSTIGSSGGGGCTTGFSVLALAVLGAFIARRKK